MTSTIVDTEPDVRASASGRLRSQMAAVRLSIQWLGVRKSLSADQKAQAAESFGAEGEFLSAGKKLLDTRHPAFRAVASVRHRAVSYWRGVSLPYPEPGLRLIPRERITTFCETLEGFREELQEAVRELDRVFDELKRQARDRLGELFDAADYPRSLSGMFGLEWDFPAVEPPNYLRQLSPELYEQESRRVAARFDEAVRLAEEAFLAELAQHIGHLAERITGADDGKPKIFRDSAVTNLREFFGRFRELNLHSSDELDRLVEQAQSVIRGVAPQDLRDSEGLRLRVASQLSSVSAALDGMLVDRPRRNILRSGARAEAG